MTHCLSIHIDTTRQELRFKCQPILLDLGNDFYSVIKDSDEHVHFAFLTGVSKFSMASIFSGLKNLQYITLDARYSTLCGYTQTELDNVFSEYMEG